MRRRRRSELRFESVIWATRRAWRPPSNAVARNVARISSARPTPTTRAPMRQDVGVVVGPGEPGRVQVVAERGAHAVDLVGGELLALAAAADDDADLGVAVADRAPDRRADRRVVDGSVVSVPRSTHVVALGRAAAPMRCCFSSNPAWSAPMAIRGHRREPTAAPRSADASPSYRGAAIGTIDPRTPVIVGVGQYLHARRPSLDDAHRAGRADEHGDRRRHRRRRPRRAPAVDSIRVVNSLTWKYGDPAASSPSASA